MEIYELVIEMKLLERRLTLYKEKYGILSEDFYAALMSGRLARYDEYDETRADFSRWKGIYETGVIAPFPSLRRLLPTLIAFGHSRLGDGHRLRSQVPLMDIMPDTTFLQSGDTIDLLYNA